VDLIEIVTVDLSDAPLEGGELRGDRTEAHDFVARSVDLKPVVVNDGDEIAELLVGGEHSSLPHLPLLDLTISEQAEHRAVVDDVFGVIATAQASRKTGGNREALPQGPGRNLDSRRLLAVGMPLQD